MKTLTYGIKLSQWKPVKADFKAIFHVKEAYRTLDDLIEIGRKALSLKFEGIDTKHGIISIGEPDYL